MSAREPWRDAASALPGARSLAQSPSLEVALDRLAGTAYGHDVKRTHTLAEAQHAIAATLLWHFRVLAGWMPWQGTPVLRLLAGVFEILNVEDLLRAGDGSARRSPRTTWARWGPPGPGSRPPPARPSSTRC